MLHPPHIPEHEIEITTSRAGGPGGQHVNKTNTKVTVRWNIKNTSILTDEEKTRVLEKLRSEITLDGDLIIHDNTSRSQLTNKKNALEKLAKKLTKALHIPKKRKKSSIPTHAKEARLEHKKRQSTLKKMRREKIDY